MLIPSSLGFADLWLEELQSVQSGCTMLQILWVWEMNYSEDPQKWNNLGSRASYNKMMQIGLYGTITHLVPLIWDKYGNTKSDL